MCRRRIVGNVLGRPPSMEETLGSLHKVYYYDDPTISAYGPRKTSTSSGYLSARSHGVSSLGAKPLPAPCLLRGLWVSGVRSA
eukprot:COSAG05_NODE_436_length_9838_cov_49.389876_4_plen_83_part_00